MNNKTLGFTLIELLIVLSIIGVTLGIAVPSFQALIDSNRLTTSANNMVSALQLAKSEAIKSNRLVVVSKNSNWTNGWVVFAEIHSYTVFDQDNDEPTISTFDAPSAGLTVIPTSGYSNRVVYRPDGRSTTNGSFVFCSSATTADFRRVVIATTGRVRVETPTEAGISYATACQ